MRLSYRLLPLGLSGPDSPLRSLVIRHRAAVLPVAALGLLGSLLEGASIGALIPIVALMLSPASPAFTPYLPGPAGDLLGDLTAGARVAAIGLLAIALVTAKGIVQTINRRLIGRIENRVGHDLRQMLVDHVLALDYPQFLVHDNVRLINIIATDSWEAIKLVSRTCASVSAAAALAVFAVLLLWMDWRLTCLVATGVVVIGLAIGILERRLVPLGEELAKANMKLGERMLLVVSAIRPIRVFGKAAQESRRFADSSLRVEEARRSLDEAMAPVVPLVETLLAVLFLGVLWAGYRMAVPIAVLSGYLVLLIRSQAHAQTIFDARVGMAALRGSVREVEWLLTLPPMESGRTGKLPAPSGPTDLVFDQVRYDYPDGSRGLDEASFRIGPGTVTALIGPSGAGKSTVVNLLCGLVRPDKGTIRVGGMPLDAFDPASWSDRIALAGQDVELVDGTIADNIAYGTAEATREEIVAAATAADAHGFIELLPLGYETRINLENMGLSGGQMQRIGLARALLRRADLLILDEATSAVDGLSERVVIGLLSQRTWFHTALVISHRRSTLSACTNGIVLERGRVVESGPLSNLTYYRTMEVGASLES